jgi:hypothetical protein
MPDVTVATASHSHKTRAVPSSARHFLDKGLSVNPIMWRCLLRVLCPVRRPVTTPDCVIFTNSSSSMRTRDQHSSLSLNAGQILPQCHVLFIQRALFFFFILCLETPRACCGSTKCWTQPSVASSSAISFPRIQANALDTIFAIYYGLINYLWCRSCGLIEMLWW